MEQILGKNAHLSTPIVKVVKKGQVSNKTKYELFTVNDQSMGVFDEVIFACHPPTVKNILENGETINEKIDNDDNLLELLSKIEYADNIIYVHSDPELMPKRRRAWASWNCIGKSDLLSFRKLSNLKKGEAMEGGESGFGNRVIASNIFEEEKKEETETIMTSSNGDGSDEKNNRMKAVYVTYWLNRLQNLQTDKDIFVSLNPHQKPDSSQVHKKLVWGHPQYNTVTLQSRKIIEEKYQGKDGLWFCGAWSGYGFHEDGCRSGFKVATALSNTPLPWVKKSAGASGEMNNKKNILVLPPPNLALEHSLGGNVLSKTISWIRNTITYRIPTAVCKIFIYYFLNKAIQKGKLLLKFNDGSVASFGDGSLCKHSDGNPVTMRIFDDWFFVKAALEYDLGLARSYMAGHFVIEPLPCINAYHPVVRPPQSNNEATHVIGDPVGLTRLFLLLIGNRDDCADKEHEPKISSCAHRYSHAMTNASGLLISKIGSLINYTTYKVMMNNSENGGSLKNIHAHYDLSNDLFRTFLDKETLMYSSAIYDAVRVPKTIKNGVIDNGGLVFRGTLEEAQWRKLDNLCERAQIEPGQKVLDIGFGWGGLSIHAAKKYGCHVIGITLSVEQKALAEERVEKEGISHLVKFEVIDYRCVIDNSFHTFCKS